MYCIFAKTILTMIENYSLKVKNPNATKYLELRKTLKKNLIKSAYRKFI